MNIRDRKWRIIFNKLNNNFLTVTVVFNRFETWYVGKIKSNFGANDRHSCIIYSIIKNPHKLSEVNQWNHDITIIVSLLMCGRHEVQYF